MRNKLSDLVKTKQCYNTGVEYSSDEDCEQCSSIESSTPLIKEKGIL